MTSEYFIIKVKNIYKDDQQKTKVQKENRTIVSLGSKFWSPIGAHNFGPRRDMKKT